jgi:hypothetical protein
MNLKNFAVPAVLTLGLLVTVSELHGKEKQLKKSDLPPAVQATADEQSKGAITRVESLTKKGKLVAYEAQINTNGKKSEVQAGPSGKPLVHLE